MVWRHHPSKNRMQIVLFPVLFFGGQQVWWRSSRTRSPAAAGKSVTSDWISLAFWNFHLTFHAITTSSWWNQTKLTSSLLRGCSSVRRRGEWGVLHPPATSPVSWSAFLLLLTQLTVQETNYLRDGVLSAAHLSKNGGVPPSPPPVKASLESSGSSDSTRDVAVRLESCSVAEI